MLSSFLAVISSSVWIISDDRWGTGRGRQVPVGHVTASSVWIIPDDRWDTGGDHQIPEGHVTASAYIREYKSREGILDVPAVRGGEVYSDESTQYRRQQTTQLRRSRG